MGWNRLGRFFVNCKIGNVLANAGCGINLTLFQVRVPNTRADLGQRYVDHLVFQKDGSWHQFQLKPY